MPNRTRFCHSHVSPLSLLDTTQCRRPVTCPSNKVLEHPKSPDFIHAAMTPLHLASLTTPSPVLITSSTPHTEAFGIPSIHRILFSSLSKFSFSYIPGFPTLNLAASMTEYTYSSSYTTSSPGRLYTPPHSVHPAALMSSSACEMSSDSASDRTSRGLAALVPTRLASPPCLSPCVTTPSVSLL